ncbi:hypothetical protein LTR60_006156, partial [Cryomyces antarcticus]
ESAKRLEDEEVDTVDIGEDGKKGQGHHYSHIAFEPPRLSPVPKPPGESHEGSCSPPPDSERCQSSSTTLCPGFSRIVSTAVIAKPSQEQHETDGHGNAASAKSRASRRPNKHKWTGPG